VVRVLLSETAFTGQQEKII